VSGVEQLDAEFVRDFKALYDDEQPIALEITKYQAWCLMASVQLALRHPEAAEKSPVIEAVAIARRLQGVIAVTPRLKAIAAAGWES
jgi:hypothetical protein